MNGTLNGDDTKQDLLPHKYRPDSIDRYSCHSQQALRLKQWIQESMNATDRYTSSQNESDYSENSSDSEYDEFGAAKKCVLLTGPPGVGKTSLVYTIANELKLHVVESHPSEKRDSKLFSMLKLTNQRGKINAIAKLFQAARQQQQQSISTRRKRRKLSESTEINQPKNLLSGDSSIVLFDDIDVVFEEDGPFLKSLVGFVKESKRPVVLTATKTIEHIKKVLIECEHIHLDKPVVEDCAKLLQDICRQEKYRKLSKGSRCTTIANHLDCDIRQCLNQIHFYGDQADKIMKRESERHDIMPNSSRLSFELDDNPETEGKCSNMKLYATCSLIDLMNSRFHLTDRSTLRDRWLGGQPSTRLEEHSQDQYLGEQIRDSIVELTKRLHSDELISGELAYKQGLENRMTRDGYLDMAPPLGTGGRLSRRLRLRRSQPEL